MSVRETEAARLPTAADHLIVIGELQNAFDDLEDVVWRLKALLYDRDGTPRLRVDPAPTLADVGALYSFSEALGLQLAQLEGLRAEVGKALYALDAARIESTGKEAPDA